MTTKEKSSGAVQEIKQDSKQAARKAAFNPVVETIARVGFAARGLIYIMIGILAIQVALGGRGASADQQGAIATIARQPFGRVLLLVILVGLVGYSLWGLIRAIFDPLHKGNDAKGIMQRLGFLFSAASYALLIPSTYAAWSGSGKAAQSGAQSAQTQGTTAALLAQSWGKWAVMAAGVIVFAVGLYQIYSGLGPKFEQQYQAYSLNRQQKYWINRIGRFGTAARGVVFALVGFFLFLAAYRANPALARGFDGALLALAQQPYGPWLLLVVAVGLVAFGIYSALGALWFRERR